MIVRHKLLADLVRLWKNDQLVEKIARLPLTLPHHSLAPEDRSRWDVAAYIKNGRYGDIRLFL